ncbi:MAG: hypothetical protein OXG38_01900 [Chloroflexi bacterium]|nr:hypothetical protein [Chloroflexota bacterium]
MRRWLLLPALVCAVGVLVGTTYTPVQAAGPAATVPVAITLVPGWNFVGWLGAAGPVDDLFALVDRHPSEIAAVLAPAPANPPAAVTWEPLARGAGRLIRPGEPLWIQVTGPGGVGWRQEALRDPPGAALEAGRHAVVWSWAGDRPFGAVLGRVVGQLVSAQRWNVYRQAFERYPSDDPSPFYVRHGEALYLQLDAPAVWGPAAGPTITGAEWLSESDQRTLEEVVAGVHAYFERWLGITPQPFEVRVQEFPFPCLRTAAATRAVLYLPCLHIALDELAGPTVAESYAKAAVPMVRERGGHTEPEWLVAGHAHYVYARWMAAAGLRPYRSFYQEMVGFTRATDLTLDSAPLQPPADRTPLGYVIDPERPFWESSRQAFERWIGALAIDWLVQWTGEAALEQYARTRFAGDWRAAFRDAFGMSVDQFTDWFEHYRPGLTAADGGALRLRRPLHSVVFAGPLTDARRALGATIEEIADFFERAYGLTASAATFVLEMDAARYEEVRAGTQTCGYVDGSLIYVRDGGCTVPYVLAHEFAHVLQFELGQGRGGPELQWLVEGAADYLALQEGLAAGRGDPETVWAVREAVAADVITAVPAAASDAEVALAAIERDWQYYVYALAGRHLVERFGIDALLAAFGPAWREAGPDEAGRFQAIFGESLDDFYASFGRWLRSLPPPPPADEADGVVCPVAWTDADGVQWVDLDAPPGCTVVRAGGTVTVSRGALVRTFTLYRGQDWLVVDGTHIVPVHGVAAVMFSTMPNEISPHSGAIRFALRDGRELDRQVPPAAAALHAIFDAITSSVPGG